MINLIAGICVVLNKKKTYAEERFFDADNVPQVTRIPVGDY
jgi:hypothetical protein